MQTSRTIVFLLSAFILVVAFQAHAEEVVVVVEECTCPCPCPAAVPSGEDEAGPDEVTINEFPKGVYGPVEFTHGEHAEYADEGCTQCHHHAPPGVYQACNTCHKPRKKVEKPEDALLPDLKGAFHRQCMGCHLDMESGPLECTECHAEEKKGEKKAK